MYEYLGIIRIDRYIISRFLGTFMFILMLIMAIIVVIDVQENLSDLLKPEVPLSEIIFSYYLALVPYFANLLAPLFIFITVIFFTSKLAARSEIIAIQAAGMSFTRLLKPYMISAAIISLVSFSFSSVILPKLNKTRIGFQYKYIKDKKVVVDDNLQVEVAPNVFAFFGSFDSRSNEGQNFSMERFEGRSLSLVSLPTGSSTMATIVGPSRTIAFETLRVCTSTLKMVLSWTQLWYSDLRTCLSLKGIMSSSRLTNYTNTLRVKRREVLAISRIFKSSIIDGLHRCWQPSSLPHRGISVCTQGEGRDGIQYRSRSGSRLLVHLAVYDIEYLCH